MYRASPEFSFVGAWQPGADESARGVLHGVSDANYGVARSTSGILIMLCGAAVLWRVVVQRSPAISPAEAEFYALSSTVAELVYARQLLEELGHVFSAATQCFCDSRAARLMADHGSSTSRTRHVHRRWHFMKFHTDDGDVWIAAIKGLRNPANGLTKFTAGPLFIRERKYMGLVAG